MADIAFTAANIRPLKEHGAIILPGVAAGTLTVGHLVYQTSSGWVRADGDVALGAPARAHGIAVESFDGETTIASGDPVSVCVFGPVSGFTSLTANANYYLSDTVGRIADAVGTYDLIIGYGVKLHGEVCIFVQVQVIDPVST